VHCDGDIIINDKLMAIGSESISGLSAMGVKIMDHACMLGQKIEPERRVGPKKYAMLGYSQMGFSHLGLIYRPNGQDRAGMGLCF
jgi:hypothetical protein